MNKKVRPGFTIVELLIVIVVIAILATISIVAYNGIQDRARVSAITSGLTQANKKMALWRVDNPNQAPASLADIGVNDTDSIAYQFTYDTTASSYCITATHSNGVSYYISSTNSTAQTGTCSGYNLLAWTKPSSASAPIIGSGAIIDTSVFRTSTASIRLGPGVMQKSLRGYPFGGTAGQKYTVSFWMLTDAGWNGTGGNSKVRISSASDGTLLAACSYNGVKVTWTQFSCTYTLTAGAPQINITVSNDGTVGNIWLDEVSLSLI